MSDNASLAILARAQVDWLGFLDVLEARHGTVLSEAITNADDVVLSFRGDVFSADVLFEEATVQARAVLAFYRQMDSILTTYFPSLAVTFHFPAKVMISELGVGPKQPPI